MVPAIGDAGRPQMGVSVSRKGSVRGCSAAGKNEQLCTARRAAGGAAETGYAELAGGSGGGGG